MTPEEKLNSSSWRLRNSLWILVPIVSVGMATWAAFLFVGLRAKRKRWLLYAALWLVVYVAYWVAQPMVEEGGLTNPILAGVSSFLDTVPLICWVGGIAHVSLNNRSWLRWKARSGNLRAWYSETDPDAQPAAAPLTAPDAAQIDSALRGKVAPAPTPSIPAAPTEQLDLNLATAAELQTALGLNQAWGDWLVATRTRLGRYSSVDQLLTEGQLPPHLYMAGRDKLTVRPLAAQPAGRVRRRLDL